MHATFFFAAVLATIFAGAYAGTQGQSCKLYAQNDCQQPITTYTTTNGASSPNQTCAPNNKILVGDIGVFTVVNIKALLSVITFTVSLVIGGLLIVQVFGLLSLLLSIIAQVLLYASITLIIGWNQPSGGITCQPKCP